MEHSQPLQSPRLSLDLQREVTAGLRQDLEPSEQGIRWLVAMQPSTNHVNDDDNINLNSAQSSL